MKIRIGNDFKTKWAITWLGEPEDFSDATDIALFFNIYDKKIELTKDVDYTITDNIIEIDVTPDICNILGVYNLELHYTKPNSDFIDGERRSAVDIDAFRIVGKSEKADATQDVSIISDAVAIFLDIAYKKLEEIEANEDVRITNENEREDAEDIRVSNEITRVSNENIRIDNEQQRQIDVSTAIGNAEQATLNANNSAVYANEQGTYANEQGAYAEEMSSHPPTIINDYWHIWNFTTNQYESTGQYARGDSAIDGALVVQEKGQSAVNTMSQKAITDELAQLAGDVSTKTSLFENYNNLTAGIEKIITGDNYSPSLNLEPSSIQAYDKNGNLLSISARYVKNGELYDTYITSDVSASYVKINIIARNEIKAKGWAFMDASDAIDIPVDTIAGWSMMRTGGSTITAELSVVDIAESNRIKKIGSGKAVKFITGDTGHYANIARYALPAPLSIEEFRDKNILIWVKIDEGEGLTSWETASGLYLDAAQDSSAYIRYILGANGVQFADHGWYAFSLSPIEHTSITGDVTTINSIGVVVAKGVADSPTVQIGRISIVPKKQKAQICFMADGGRPSHKPIADLLTNYGMKGTFYVASTVNTLPISDLHEMQNNGHLIANYVINFGADGISVNDKIMKVESNKAWMQANGLFGGRYIVHGVTSLMTEDIWEALVPEYADVVSYASSGIGAQYQKTYIGRYHEFKSANKATLVSKVNNAVAGGARLGILLHDLTGQDYTDFVDFVENTLLPLKASGDIDVITVKQAFESK